MTEFNPKITEGPWIPNDCSGVSSEINYPGTDIGIEICSLDDGEYIENENKIEDAKAIAAVPELLEVYKAAKPALEMMEDWCSDMEGGDRFLISQALSEIKKLEEQHCEKDS